MCNAIQAIECLHGVSLQRQICTILLWPGQPEVHDCCPTANKNITENGSRGSVKSGQINFDVTWLHIKFVKLV